MKALRPY
jgi:hypothetical protein